MNIHKQESEGERSFLQEAYSALRGVVLEDLPDFRGRPQTQTFGTLPSCFPRETDARAIARIEIELFESGDVIRSSGWNRFESCASGETSGWLPSLVVLVHFYNYRDDQRI